MTVDYLGIVKTLEAAEVLFLRRMQKISCTSYIENWEVLNRAGTKRQLMKVILKMQLGFLGHVVRRQGFENWCLPGKLDGI